MADSTEATTQQQQPRAPPPHPKCQDVIDALFQCHKDNPYAKFFGECNDHKIDMDRCFRAHKEERRRANFLQSRREDDWARVVAKRLKEEEEAATAQKGEAQR